MVAISSVAAEIAEAAIKRMPVMGVPLSAPARQRAEAYLRGPSCSGMVELLCNYRHSRSKVPRNEGDETRLRSAFQHELTGAMKLANDESRRLAHLLWEEIEVLVVANTGRIDPSDKIVIRVCGPERPLSERLGLALNPKRRDSARDVAASIREATAAAGARMVMPHAKADYRFAMSQIYVLRKVRRKDRPPIDENAVTARRFVVVGNPGAGKSTFIRNLIRRVARDDSGLVPMLVMFKQHQSLTEDFVTIIARELRPLVQREVPRQQVADLFEVGRGLVVFDGLDEVGDVNSRRAAVTAIEAFAARFPLARIVVTCREESYLIAKLDDAAFPVFWLPDFDDDQVAEYIRTWFELVPHHLVTSEERAAAFLRDSTHVHDLRSNPLMLSLLCMLYQREGYIPENSADVYRECAELMLVRWDSVSHVPSTTRSSVRLAKLLVQELAQHFFFALDGQGAERESALKRLVVAHLMEHEEEDSRTYHQQAQDFLDYCAERAWVLTQVDTSPDGERMFGFTHRTFMEYYTANHVLRTCATAEELVSCLLPMITTAKSHVLPRVALQLRDVFRADGGDECVQAFLEASDAESLRVRVVILLFCMSYFEHNPLRTATAEALVERVLDALGATGDMDLAVSMGGMRGRKLDRITAVMGDVIKRTSAERKRHTDIRLGAGLLSGDPAVTYEVVLGKVRHLDVDPESFVQNHGAGDLLYAELSNGELVAGPLVHAISVVTGSWSHRLGRALELLAPVLPNLVPIPASVLPDIIAALGKPGVSNLSTTFGMGNQGFCDLVAVVTAAAADAGHHWPVAAELVALSGVPFTGESPPEVGVALSQYCLLADLRGRPVLDCLRQWAAGEMSFVDFTR
jgi:hypothetical protein